MKNEKSEQIIRDYLNAVKNVMRAAGRDEDDISDILNDLELHIRAQSEAAGQNAPAEEIEKIIGKMDPPQAFADEIHGAGKPVSIQRNIWWGLIVVLLGSTLAFVALHYRALPRGSNQANPSNDVQQTSQAESDQPAVPDATVVPANEESEDNDDVVQMRRAATESQPPETEKITLAIAGFSVSGVIRDEVAVRMVLNDGLINTLSASEGLRIVEREQLEHGLRELRMGAEGMLDQDSALALGRILGARVIVTGNIVQIDDKIIITARLINAETSELSAARVEGDRGRLLELTDLLAQNIIEKVNANKSGALSRAANQADVYLKDNIANLREKLQGVDLPRVLIMIPESHLNRTVPDPAAETEIVRWLTDCGFRVASPVYEGFDVPAPMHSTTASTDVTFQRNGSWRNESGNIQISSQSLSEIKTKVLGDERKRLKGLADLIILGEGVSERASERGGLISCQARLELKVIDIESGRVLLAASEYGHGIDVAEHIAGKRALQAAAQKLAPSLIENIVSKWLQND